MGLATTGVIPFETAAALVLGQNVGTTITAYLASLGASTNAKRAAYAHIIFNVLGVLWVTSIFHFYIQFVLWIVVFIPDFLLQIDTTVITGPLKDIDHEHYSVYVSACIAATHTIFNVVASMVMVASQVLSNSMVASGHESAQGAAPIGKFSKQMF